MMRHSIQEQTLTNRDRLLRVLTYKTLDLRHAGMLDLGFQYDKTKDLYFIETLGLHACEFVGYVMRDGFEGGRP